MYETVSAGFRDAGIPEERIVSSIVALESFIFGSAYDVTAPADIFDSGSTAEATPSFTGAVRSLAAQGHERPADVAFSLGLEALISGSGRFAGRRAFYTVWMEATVSGVPVHYAEYGSGTPVLALHGAGLGSQRDRRRP